MPRALRILGLALGATLAACAPLLAFDDLAGDVDPDAGAGDATKRDGDVLLDPIIADGGAPKESGTDSAYDGGDLCALAPEDSFYCGDALKPGVAPTYLYYCENKRTAPDAAYYCAVQCIRMPPGHGDLCSRCSDTDFGNGSYCVKDFKSSYSSANDVVITCKNHVATVQLCSSECVADGATSHCP